MNLSIFWRLRNLVSPAIDQVVRSSRHAQDVINRVNQSIQRGFNNSGETIDSLRQRIRDIETARNSMRIGVDTRQIQAANSEIDRLNRQLDRVEGRRQGSGSILPRGLGVGIGLVGAIGAAQSALNKGMDMEVAEANFKHFVGNVDIAQGLIKQLQDYGDKYAMYKRADLINSGTAIAETFGAGQVMELTNIIGALAKGKSENFMGIMTRLQQVKGTGYLQGDELMELMNRGVFGLQEQIAKNKKITIAQFNKLKEAQQISWNDVKTALIQMTSEGGKYFGVLDERMKQTKGKWDTIASLIENKITDFGKLTSGGINGFLGFVVRLLQGTKPIEEALANLWDAFKPIFTVVRELLVYIGLINPAGDAVQQTVSLLTNVFNILAKVMTWVVSGFKWLVDVFKTIPFSKYIAQFLLLNLVLKGIGVIKLVTWLFSLGSALTSTVGIIGLLQKAWIALNTTFVLSPIGLIVTAVVALIAAIYYAWTECEKFREVVTGVWGGIKEVWGATVGWLIDEMVYLWDNLKGAWGEGATALGTALRISLAIVTLGISEVVVYAIQNWEKFKAAMIAGSRAMLAIVTFGLSEFVIRNWEKLKGFWDKFKGYAVDAIQAVITAMFPLLSIIAMFTKDKFKKGYNQAVSEMNNNKGLENWYDTRDERTGSYMPKVPGVPGVPGGLGAGGAGADGKGAGITDTVEGAKSKSIVININKGLIETSNIIVDNKGTGLDIERQVVEILNRIIMSGERLAYE